MKQTIRVQGRILASAIIQPKAWMDEPIKYYARIEPFQSNQINEIEEHLRQAKDQGSYGYYESQYADQLPTDYVTFGSLVIFQSLFQPKIIGQLNEYTYENEYINTSVQAVGHLEQMSGGNHFLAFDLIEPFNVG